MADTISGQYDENGNPCVGFSLLGVAHEPPGLSYQGIVDTGFAGFIQLPFIEACRLRLPLEGTASTILADGTTRPVLTALGEATLGDETITGTIYLSSSREILIGMDFLRKFNHALAVFSDDVFLFREEKFEP